VNGTTLAIAAYVLASLVIGAWVGRRVRTEEDYILAGRSLGYVLTTFTVFATWFGAETCIGAAGAIYGEGLSGGTSDPFGYGVCLLLMGLVFAVPLWRLRLTTLADLLRQRYSAGVERLAVVVMVPTSLLWAAAQIRAFGQIVTVSSGIEVEITIALAALVVIAYTAFGGMLADAWTDLIQGVALIVGLLLLFVVVMARGGAAALAQVEPERLRWLVPAGGSALDAVEAWAIPVCGSVLAAELVARVIAARSATVARRSTLLAAGLYLATGAIPVLLGLAGFHLMPDLEHPEQLLPKLAGAYLHPVLFALVAGALLSAILSTVDSALLVAASLVSHNLISAVRPGLGDRGRVRAARCGVVVFGVVAWALATRAEGVYALVEEASAFGSAGIFVAVVVGLFSRVGGRVAAHAAIVAGLVSWGLGAYALGLDHPYLTSLAAAIAAYGLGAVAEAAYGRSRR
jgi:Na+/proline symporter